MLDDTPDHMHFNVAYVHVSMYDIYGQLACSAHGRHHPICKLVCVWEQSCAALPLEGCSVSEAMQSETVLRISKTRPWHNAA